MCLVVLASLHSNWFMVKRLDKNSSHVDAFNIIGESLDGLKERMVFVERAFLDRD